MQGATKWCIVAVALVISGCGGEGDETDTKPLPRAQADCGRPLPVSPGTYSTRFRPLLTFAVPDAGWETFCAQTPDSFSLGPPQAAIDFVKGFTVFDPRSGAAESAPADMGAWIEDHPRMKAAPPARTTVGGKKATRIDTTIQSAPAKLPPGVEGRCLPTVRLKDRRVDPLCQPVGDRVRWIIVENVGGQALLVVIGGAEFGRFLPRAQKLLSSLKFE